MNKTFQGLLRDLFQHLLNMLLPMRFWIGDVSVKNLQYDFWAGLTGAVMVLPQAIAFSLIAGLPPEFGLYSAIVVQLIAGFFGSSRHMVTGPTVALSIVIPGIVLHYAEIGTPEYIGFSLTLMFIVGGIQLAFGLFRLGSLVNFISHTVIIGFTAGAGFLIMSSLLPSYLGIEIPRGLPFIEKCSAIYAHLGEVQWKSVVIATVTLTVALILRRIERRLPYMLIGMLAGTFIAFVLDRGDSDIAMLGELSAAFPKITIPALDFKTISAMLPSALALALLGLIEAVSISRSIAIRSHQHIDGNQEFVGQGLANIVGSCASCYVGSGSFNRSAVNYDSGAKTPIALLFTSSIVVAVLLFSPWITRYLPIPAMSGTIMLAGYNLFDFQHIKIIARTSRSELTIILVTFFSTLFLNLAFAIYVGVILSLILYLQKTAHPILTPVDFSSVKPISASDGKIANLTVLRLDGSLFFGAVNHVQSRLTLFDGSKNWQYVVILAEGVNIIDIAGVEMLLAERHKLQKRGGDLFIIGMKPHVRRKLRRSPYWRQLGGQYNMFESTYIAFRTICKSLEISNYRQFMKHLFRDYNKLASLPT